MRWRARRWVVVQLWRELISEIKESGAIAAKAEASTLLLLARKGHVRQRMRKTSRGGKEEPLMMNQRIAKTDAR